jgi:hypothetical protein
VCSLPAAIATGVPQAETAVGVRMDAENDPLPDWPNSLRPHTHTVPFDCRATEWSLPAPMATMLVSAR